MPCDCDYVADLSTAMHRPYCRTNDNYEERPPKEYIGKWMIVEGTPVSNVMWWLIEKTPGRRVLGFYTEEEAREYARLKP